MQSAPQRLIYRTQTDLDWVTPVSHELNFPTFAVLCHGKATLALNSSLRLWDTKKTVKYL